MDTGSDPTVLLARVTWLADSRRVAIERLNRVQDHLELLFADAASGKCETVLTEKDKYWVNLAGAGFLPPGSEHLHFFAVGKAFPWTIARSGFLQLFVDHFGSNKLPPRSHCDRPGEHLPQT